MAESEGKDTMDLVDEAQRHVLEEIKETNWAKSQRALHLAEAYAWLASPRQPHGGGGSSSD